MPTRYEARRTVRATPEQVWAVLADHVGMSSWTPAISSRLEKAGAPDPNGVGAVRGLLFPTGRIREEVTAFEPVRRLQYRMLSGLPVRDYVGEVLLTPGEGATTDVVWSMTFRERAPGLRYLLKEVLRRLANGLVTGAEQAAR